MKPSKIPIYAFVDETGNTGHNLFDEVQPDFYTAALVSKGNFDITASATIQALANRLNVPSLHAKELGQARLEVIADDLLELIHVAQVDFFVSRVEKRYLLATKVFDSLFDTGENAAVAWHHYNVRPLRLMLTFKLAMTIDKETAKQFWKCILEPNEAKAYSMLPDVCAHLMANLDRVPDKRSREVLGQGLEWAHAHPESIQIHTDRKTSRQGHFPNLVAFANLLDGLDKHARDRNRYVARIVHDRQSEFEKTLRMWHEFFSLAPSGPGRWDGEDYSLQKVPGSQFEISADSDSAGIQVADIILWLYKLFRQGKPLAPKCEIILAYALSHGWENDFSFSGVERMYVERFGQMQNADLSPEQWNKARVMLERAETSREASMARYEVDRIPPFMRKNPTS